MDIKNYHKNILSESIVPRHTEFGTDFKNGEWRELDSGLYITFFESNNNMFGVLYNKNGMLSFVTNYQKPDININDIKSFNDLILRYGFSRKPVSNVLMVFNQVFYVMLKTIDHFKPIEIWFQASDDVLELTYNRLVANKSFLKSLHDHGLEYTGFTVTTGKYTFIRK